uniref:Sodium/hydrogen exchanger n=1 Tax=Rhabditophanes sp. KR3021 TaxID=114890 RepID=A0AC35UFW4_9BILA
METMLLLLVLLTVTVQSSYMKQNLTSSFNILDIHLNVSSPQLIICGWLLLAAGAKIVFHLSKRLNTLVPDSASLIILGWIVGFILKLSNVDESYFVLDAYIFYFYLLVPIIFEAGFFIPNRAIIDNAGSIATFAVIGTLTNAALIGAFMYGFQCLGAFTMNFTINEIILFSSLISSVDPVAVIALFEKLDVNALLYVLIFGESLFNDGISVTLVYIFLKFHAMKTGCISSFDYIKAAIKFPINAFGGLIIGVFFGIIVSYVTKHSYKVKALNPVFIFVIPYMAFLTAEVFETSGILALVSCGMFMKQYISKNISVYPASAVKFFIKMLSHISESVIYMFLGMSAITYNHYWDTWFVILTIVSCLLFRVISTFALSFILNLFRINKISTINQVVMAYSGLRGSISFGICSSLPDTIPAKRMFMTACIAEIYFTIFIQGLTIRPLLKWLHVEGNATDNNTNKNIRRDSISNRSTMTISGTCLEEIKEAVDRQASSTKRWSKLKHRYLDPFLLRNDIVHDDSFNPNNNFHRNVMKNFFVCSRQGGIDMSVTDHDEGHSSGDLEKSKSSRKKDFSDGVKDFVRSNKIMPADDAISKQPKTGSVEALAKQEIDSILLKHLPTSQHHLSTDIIKCLMEKKILRNFDHECDIEDDFLLEMKKRSQHH